MESMLVEDAVEIITRHIQRIRGYLFRSKTIAVVQKGEPMTEQGTDRHGAEYKRTTNDFRFRLLEQDNCVCSVCHGIGAKIELRYVTRNSESARRRGKICKTLQAHEHSFWICQRCLDNMKAIAGLTISVERTEE